MEGEEKGWAFLIMSGAPFSYSHSLDTPAMLSGPEKICSSKIRLRKSLMERKTVFIKDNGCH